MLLKRLYDHSGEAPRLSGIKVLHAGPRQRFSPHLVDAAVLEGWMTLGDGKIILHVQPKPLTYRTVRMPGYYCCHCGERLPGAVEAKTHVVEHAEAKPSPSWFRKLIGEKPASGVPDPANPAGYRQDNFYECVLESP